MLGFEGVAAKQKNYSRLGSTNTGGVGLGCRNVKAAYQLAAACKRYLMEIFAKPDNIKRVTVYYCMHEPFANAFALRCVRYLQNQGIEVLILPILVMPLQIMSEDQRSMVQEVAEEIMKLSYGDSRMRVIPDDAGTRFCHTLGHSDADIGQLDVKKLKRLSHLFYRVSFSCRSFSRLTPVSVADILIQSISNKEH